MKEHFTIGDVFVFFGTLMISFSIGIFFAVRDAKKKRNTPDDYFLADRKSRTLPVALSYIVTFQSSLLILAVPIEVYVYSMMYCYHIVGIFLSYIAAAFIVVPVFYPLQVTSVNQYFYLRYGDNLVRYLGVFSGVTFNIFYMGTVIYGTCVAVEVMVGIPYWGTVLIYTTITTIYTAIGGIKAVIWTDVFQMFTMLLGILAVLIKSTVDAGGISKVTELASNQLYMGEMSFDPTVRYTVWNVSIGTFTTFLFNCLNQSGIQRIKSTPKLSSARSIYFIAAPIYCIIFFMTAYEGVTIFAYHASKGCDIYNGGLVDNINEIVPVTVIELFKNIPGLTGLFIASLSSAALSTLSSCLSSLAAITYGDVIRVLYPNMGDGKATKLSKCVVLLYGLIGMGMTFLIAKIPGSVISICASFMGCLDGPTTAIFMMSVFFKRASSKGVFIGALCGIGFSFWLVMGRTFSSIPADPRLPSGPVDKCSLYENSSYVSLDNYSSTDMYTAQNRTLKTDHQNGSHTPELTFLETMYKISYILYSLIGFLVTLTVGIVISLLTTPPENVDEKYMFSFEKHILRDIFGKHPESMQVNTCEIDKEISDEDGHELETVPFRLG